MSQKFTKEWAYPVTDWKIIFRFKHLHREYCHDFYNVSTLSNYFHSVPEQGLLVGYGKELPHHRMRQNILPVSGGKLSMWYVENGKEHFLNFRDASHFASFLNRTPTVAKAVSYFKK
jgi:hypothetical protein